MAERRCSPRRRPAAGLLALLLLAACTSVRLIPDPAFEPGVVEPAYPAGEGPLVLVDEAHHNYHTADGRYTSFRQLLEADGYRVEPLTAPATSEALAGADLLVIANALAEANVRRWRLPTPSAFSAAEIAAIEAWVAAGRSLFLIADHMPFPGAAEDLAAAFGVFFGNGYARGEGGGTLTFSRADGSLADHPVTRGRTPAEAVESVVAFGGQAFRAGVEAAPLMVLAPDSELLMPVRAGRFSERTPRLPAAGLLQGAVLRRGEGRLAVFGEAAMFTTQIFLRGEEEVYKMGMSVAEAAGNRQFLLNLVHWLSGLLPEEPPAATIEGR